MEQQELTAGFAPPPTVIANVEAEAAVLGACMIDNRLIDELDAVLSQKDFYDTVHGRIWRACLRMRREGKTANPVTLRPVFAQDRYINRAEYGGPHYLAMLTGSGAALIGARDMADQVRVLARMRDVQESIGKGFEDVEDSGSLESFLLPIEQAVSAANAAIKTFPTFSLADMIGMTEARAERSIETCVPGATCKLIPDMDTLLGRLEGGQMTILAGRPGMGKSTTAMSATLGYAMNGHPGQYLLAESSAEMFALKITADLLHAARAQVPFKSLREAILDNAERRSVAKAKEVAATLPLTFAYVGRTDIRRIESMVAKEALKRKREGRRLEFVVVDYLQLITAEGRHRVGDNIGRVNAVSEGLLSIAQRHDTHMIALSQLNRGLEGREDKRPKLSDLRESGRLEEDADNVLMVYREEYYLDKTKPQQPGKELDAWEIDMGAARGRIEFIAAKTRFGANATRKGHFLGDYSAVRGSNFDHGRSLFEQDPDDDIFNAFFEGGER